MRVSEPKLVVILITMLLRTPPAVCIALDFDNEVGGYKEQCRDREDITHHAAIGVICWEQQLCSNPPMTGWESKVAVDTQITYSLPIAFNTVFPNTGASMMLGQDISRVSSQSIKDPHPGKAVLATHL